MAVNLTDLAPEVRKKIVKDNPQLKSRAPRLTKEEKAARAFVVNAALADLPARQRIQVLRFAIRQSEV